MWVSATWERHQKKQRHLWLHQINPLTPALPDLFPPSSSTSLGDEIPCRDCMCAISPSLIWKCGRAAQGCDGYLLSVLSLHACWLCKSLLWDHTPDHAGVVQNSFYLSVSSLMPPDNGDIISECCHLGAPGASEARRMDQAGGRILLLRVSFLSEPNVCISAKRQTRRGAASSSSPTAASSRTLVQGCC